MRAGQKRGERVVVKSSTKKILFRRGSGNRWNDHVDDNNDKEKSDDDE